jgi:hypothetical protein
MLNTKNKYLPMHTDKCSDSHEAGDILNWMLGIKVDSARRPLPIKTAEICSQWFGILHFRSPGTGRTMQLASSGGRMGSTQVSFIMVAMASCCTPAQCTSRLTSVARIFLLNKYRKVQGNEATKMDR